MSISIVFARGLVATAQARGCDIDALLERCGMRSERLLDCAGVMTLEESLALMSEVMVLTNDAGLGLTLGATAPVRMLQVFGLLLYTPRTLRDAFESFRRYGALLDESPRWELEELGDLAAFVGVPALIRLGNHTRFGMEFALAMAFRIGTHFVGVDARPSYVQCQHAEPRYVQRYVDLFGCPVRFSESRYALVFPRAYLDVAQPYPDPTTHAALVRAADMMLSARARSARFSDRVRTYLRHQFPFTQHDSQRLAERMGCSVRALRRRLHDEGTSLNTLVGEARCEVACSLLGRIDGSVRKTSETIGFSEVSAFHRAFKRWTGVTPAEYRAGLRRSAALELRVG